MIVMSADNDDNDHHSLFMSGGAYRPGDLEPVTGSQAPRLASLTLLGEMGLTSSASVPLPVSVLINTGLMLAPASILTSSASATWTGQ